MNKLDKLREAWQSQCHKPINIDPNRRLVLSRIERRVHLFVEVMVMLVLSYCGIWMVGRVENLQEDWPWLIYTAFLAWVVGFMIFHQFRRRRHAPRYDEPLLTHVEWSIKDIEYRNWQDRLAFWWYTFPIVLACVIPTTIVFGVKIAKTRDWSVLVEMLFVLGPFAIYFVLIHVVRFRLFREGRRHELEVLKSLRKSLLDADSRNELI